MYCAFTENNNEVTVWAKATTKEEAFAKAELAVLEAFGSRDPRFETTTDALEVVPEKEVQSSLCR